MRLLTYNVHSCVGTDSHISVSRIARVIARTHPDVVCLQELDLGRRRTRRADQAQELAEALVMDFHFHPAMVVAEEKYGDAILTPHPMRVVRADALPTARSLLPVEPRGAIWAAVAVGGVEWQIINTHLGLGRNERRLQARALVSAAWGGAASRRAPLVVCGDFNSRPDSKTIALLTEHWRDAQTERPGLREETFPTALPLLCLDYCFVGEGVRVHGAQAVRTALSRVASDHFPLLAELSWVPPPSV